MDIWIKIHTYIQMYARVYVCVCACIRTTWLHWEAVQCLRVILCEVHDSKVDINLCISIINTYIYMYICIHIYIQMHERIYNLCNCVCIYTHARLHWETVQRLSGTLHEVHNAEVDIYTSISIIYIYTCIRIDIYRYMYVYVRMYVYTHTHGYSGKLCSVSRVLCTRCMMPR